MKTNFFFFFILIFNSSLGDIINKFGDLMPRYYATSKTVTEKGQDSYGCQYNSPSPEMHPLKWVLTRQIGCIFWCLGEIVADWYPLLRTKAVCKEKKNIRMVYVTCGIFNFFKVLLIIYHFTLSPSKLYNEEGVYDKKKIDLFYFNYWLIQLAIIYTSAIYDGSVYIVLKKNFDKMNYTQFGFIGKFKTISEYRILVSAIVCAIFLPIISVTIILKYYYYLRYDYHNLEFSFDEIRQSINNVQYFMIFIDQILLFQSKNEASVEVSRPKSSMILGNGSKNDIYRSRSIIKNMSNINFSNNNNSVYDFKNQYNTNYIPKFNPSPSNDSINMNNVYSNIYSNSNININNSENLYNYNFNSSNETIIKIENNNEEKSQKSGSSESTIYYFNS